MDGVNYAVITLLTEFDFKISNHYWPPLLILEVIRHLRLSTIWNLNDRYGSEGQCASICQIWWRSVKPLPRYGDLSFFNMYSGHHLEYVVHTFRPPKKTRQNLVKSV